MYCMVSEYFKKLLTILYFESIGQTWWKKQIPMHVLQRFKKDNLGTNIPAHAGSDDRYALSLQAF